LHFALGKPRPQTEDWMNRRSIADMPRFCCAAAAAATGWTQRLRETSAFSLPILQATSLGSRICHGRRDAFQDIPTKWHRAGLRM
jgi:hypothetical protein